MKWAFPLRQYPKVVQPEMYAILRALTWSAGGRLEDRPIATCNNRQTTLGVFSGPFIISKVIQDCTNRLSCASRFHTVEQLWVPGRFGVEGNEILNTVVKEGSIPPTSAPEPKIIIQYWLRLLSKIGKNLPIMAGGRSYMLLD